MIIEVSKQKDKSHLAALIFCIVAFVFFCLLAATAVFTMIQVNRHSTDSDKCPYYNRI